MKFKILIILLFTSTFTSCKKQKTIPREIWGVINVPVADLMLHSVDHYTQNISPREFFAALPLSAQNINTSFPACPRAHQALFNEQVKILATTEDQIYIEVPHLMYGIDEKTKLPLLSFWTLKEWVTPLKSLKKNKQLYTIPPSERTNNNTIIILIKPFYDHFHQRTYSFGTRFVRAPKHDTIHHYAVSIWNTMQQTPYILIIPRDHCVIETQLSPTQARKQFVRILHSLVEQAAQGNGIIPYVWGGSSYVHPYRNKPAKLKQKRRDTHHINQWERAEKYVPHNGFDCSELIWRVAQLCGIPYLYKTTIIAQKFLEKLGPDEFPQEGDIIWMNGHVQIISDLNNHELIEASGYEAGFGKVQKMKLADIFKNITTYQELIKIYREQKPLIRLTAQGEEYREYLCCVILKLPS